MRYDEFEVPTTLRRYVQCVWHLADPDPDQRAETVYPDGRCELIVHRGVPMARLQLDRDWRPQDRTLFAGQLTGAIRLSALGPVDCIGVRLKPAASACLVQRPERWVDRVDDLATIDAALAAALVQAVADFDRDPTPLWALLEHRLSGQSVDERIETAIEHLEVQPGRIRIETLAGEVAMSLRSFQSRFLAAVGIGPKIFARIVRLQATLRALDRQPASLAEMAVDAGFSDQAHATREIGRLTGLTPARLRQALNGSPDAESTLRMAAAFVRGSG